MKRIFLFFILFFTFQTGHAAGTDQYAETPHGDFRSRAEDFSDFCISHGDRNGPGGIFTQLVVAESGRELETNCIETAIELISNRDTGCGISLTGLLCLAASGDIPESLRERTRTAALGFDYSAPESGIHSTESGRIVSHTAELLAGRLFGEEAFTDSQKGAEHAAWARTAVLTWLEERFIFGFPEWLSISYEDYIVALCTLYDFSGDEEIKRKAGLVLDLLFYELALSNFHGSLPTSAGLSDFNSVTGREHVLSPVLNLIFGTGTYLPRHIAAAASLATGSYRCPEVIAGIAGDQGTTLYSHQQCGMVEGERPDENVNISTYRTRDYIISCANDYNLGKAGYGETVWQASLAPGLVVFSTHPGQYRTDLTPGYWTGNAALPRAGQYRGTVVCMYASEGKGLDATHAYFPRDMFDEVVHYGEWLFGRKGEGYVALHSKNPTRWYSDSEGMVNDLVATGRNNVWICEVSSESESGAFMEFILAMNSSPVRYTPDEVTYESPNNGKITFSRENGLSAEGDDTGYRNFRYHNLYGKTTFGSRTVEISRGGGRLVLKLD